jgi:hypothetical protein
VPGEVVSDAYNVPVAEDAPPGVYWLDVGLYPAEQPELPLPLLVDGQAIDRNSVRLGPVKVGGPPPGVTVPNAAPQHPLEVSFGEQITLLGFDLAGPAGRRAGDLPAGITGRQSSPIGLSLFWRAEGMPPADYTVFVHLLDAQGNLAGQADSPPAGGAYPTSLWETGETIVDERLLPDLPAGRYFLQVGLYRADTGERLPAAGWPAGAVRLTELEIN